MRTSYSKMYLRVSFILLYYPENVSNEINNALNWKHHNLLMIIKITLKCILNTISLYFQASAASAIVISQHINPCTFFRSHWISLTYLEIMTDSHRNWIMYPAWYSFQTTTLMKSLHFVYTITQFCKGLIKPMVKNCKWSENVIFNYFSATKDEVNLVTSFLDNDQKLPFSIIFLPPDCRNWANDTPNQIPLKTVSIRYTCKVWSGLSDWYYW